MQSTHKYGFWEIDEERILESPVACLRHMPGALHILPISSLKQYMTEFCEEEIPEEIYDNPCQELYCEDNILVILFNHNFQVKTAPVIEVQPL